MKTIIFGGTTEGREQAALALARGESVLVSVTSEYARQFLPEGAACHRRDASLRRPCDTDHPRLRRRAAYPLRAHRARGGQARGLARRGDVGRQF